MAAVTSRLISLICRKRALVMLEQTFSRFIRLEHSHRGSEIARNNIHKTTHRPSMGVNIWKISRYFVTNYIECNINHYKNMWIGSILSRGSSASKGFPLVFALCLQHFTMLFPYPRDVFKPFSFLFYSLAMWRYYKKSPTLIVRGANIQHTDPSSKYLNIA